MTKKERDFVSTVWKFYKENGRHTLPWRLTTAPYKILVSEIMLQQTQVERVLPKYKAFIKQFPTVHALAAASLKEVLIAWQGLGYNRRAKMLHSCAKAIVSEHKGRFPRKREELIALPGIGPYTSSAVLAFAYDQPVVLIETNIRSVFLHHFFNDATQVSDAELLPLIERTVSPEDVREWYWALMDYGTHIKKTFGNPNVRSLQHVTQSTFKGSDRQIRGAIIRLLSKDRSTAETIHAELSSFEDIRIDAQLEKLKREEMIVQKGKTYELP